LHRATLLAQRGEYHHLFFAGWTLHVKHAGAAVEQGGSKKSEADGNL